MGRLIADHCARLFFSGLSCAGFRVVFAVGTRPLHDGSSRGWDLPRWTTHFAASAVHPIKRDSPAHVPAGTSLGRSRVNALRQDWPQAAPPAAYPRVAGLGEPFLPPSAAALVRRAGEA